MGGITGILGGPGGVIGGAVGGFAGGGGSQQIPPGLLPKNQCNPNLGDRVVGSFCQPGPGRADLGRVTPVSLTPTHLVPVPGIIGAIQRGLPGGATGLQTVGGVSEPGVMQIERRVCPRKHVLGADGGCYPKGMISNKQRWWPAPRRPLLTGGDLNAIATAARAARRLQTAQKRLQKLGMLPKPKSSSRRRLAAPAHTHHGGTLKVIEEIS